MSVSRWPVAVVAALALMFGVSTSTPTVPSSGVSVSVPIVGEITNGVQTFVSTAVGEATKAVCTITGDETLCLLTVLSFRIATDYKRPDGTHVVRSTGALVNVPSLIDSTGDGLPDLTVTVLALSPSNIRLTIQKGLLAPATMPVSVEAVVTDPTTENRRINIGYDARDTTAPREWKAQASLTTGTTTTVDATMTVKNPPGSLTVVGGLFVKDDDGNRNDPKQARLKLTPVPASSTINFALAPESKSGTVSAVTPTKAELDLTMLDGTSGQHVLGTLANLQQPVGLLMDKRDGSGMQTDGTTGNDHVRLSTAQDVNQAKLVYEAITEAQVLQRVRLAAGPLPATTDFTQTPNGLLVDTSTPIAQVAGGVASGVPAADGNPAIPVPPSFPVESNEASYVHQDTTGGVDSTTFRMAGVQHVSVETTGPEDDRRIAIGARLASAPLHALVTNDKAPGGTRYDATVDALPHNFAIAIAPARKRILDFCGSSSDAADPCSPAGQAAPAGIESIVLHESFSPTPLFGRATHLNGSILGIPSTLGLDVETRAPVDDTDPDQNTRVHIDTTRPVGRTILRATDGSPAPADPVDNGIVYLDTPAKYAVVAKVHGFRKAHLDTAPKLDLDLTAAAGHDFSFAADVPGDDGAKHLDGVLPNRPATTHVTLASPESAPTVLTVSGADANGVPQKTPKLVLNLDQEKPLFSEATHLQAEVSDIPASVTLTIDSRSPEDPGDLDQNTKVHIDASQPIGRVLLRATDGQAPPADPVDNGVVYQEQPGEPFAVLARIDGFRSVHLDTVPKLDVTLTAAAGHDLSYGIHLPPEDGKPAKDFTGVVKDRPVTTNFSFADPDDGPMTVHVEGVDGNGNPAGTGQITLEAIGLDDDPAEKIHNVRVDLQDVPPALDLVKQPTADPEAIDIDVSTTGGPLGVAEVQLDNGVLPDPATVPALPEGGGGAIVFTGGNTFFMHAKVLQLRSVSLTTDPTLDATLDVATPQDFRIYLDTGVGVNHQSNPNGCEDFDAEVHNAAHVEYHDVFIKNLQPNTQFHYVDGDDGGGPCEGKGWRTIEYSADGRADSITYKTSVGDMAVLKTVIGEAEDMPLKVPHHLKVCQAEDDTCFEKINRYKQCTVGGIDYDYCSTYSADASVFIESYGEKTHVGLAFCSLNKNTGDHANCTRSGAQAGVFADLVLSHLDMGYAYDNGFGFLSVNSQKHTADGAVAEGPNLGVNGYLRVIDHNSIAEYINTNFGWTGPRWDANSTKYDNSYGVITFAAPLVGTHDGFCDCVDPAYGPSWDESDSYFHVILDTAGNSEDDLGDNLTNLLCGLF